MRRRIIVAFAVLAGALVALPAVSAAQSHGPGADKPQALYQCCTKSDIVPNRSR